MVCGRSINVVPVISTKTITMWVVHSNRNLYLIIVSMLLHHIDMLATLPSRTYYNYTSNLFRGLDQSTATF